jgi:hypothetical protein
MSKHIWINPKRFASIGEKVHHDGMQIEVFLSPSDAPNGIVGTYDQKRGEFVIQFEYQNHEAPGDEHRQGKVRFIEGRYSGKLLSIVIPIDDKLFNNVSLIALKTEVSKALDARRESLKGPQSLPLGPLLNAQATQTALDGEFDELTADLMCVGA